MELKRIRHSFTDKSTIGEMSIGERVTCQSLEDTDRRLEDNPKAKIKGNPRRQLVYQHGADPRGRRKEDQEPSKDGSRND